MIELAVAPGVLLADRCRFSMNLPNKLTISRFILTIAFLAVIFSEVRFHETIALVLFSLASLTNYFDGKIAREQKLITNFGVLMDPLADKIFGLLRFHRPLWAFTACRPGWL